MKRLLFVHDHYFNQYKGTIYSQKFPTTILNRYLKVFDELTVWGRLKKVDKKPQNMSVSIGPSISFVFGKNISGLRNYYMNYNSEKERLGKLVQNANAVIVRLPSEYGLMAIQLAELLKIPYGVEVVGCAWDSYWNYGSLQAKIYAPIAYIRMKKAVATSDFIVYVSKNFLQNRYPPKKVATVTNISNVEILQPTEEVLSSRVKRIKTQKQTITFGTIGSLKTRYKGIHIAIKAMATLDNVDFEYRILGAGDTAFYESIAKKFRVDRRVKFDGNLPAGELVFEWLDNIDIYIHPSLTEGLPRAVIEAMSRGCPVLASAAGGTPEVVNKRWLHKPGDYNELGGQMKRMLSSEKTMLQEARVNFETSKHYRKDKLEKKRDKFLMDILESIE
ncbi:MAG: glycosyltransferase [Candidatus Paceibacterota bacterium]